MTGGLPWVLVTGAGGFVGGHVARLLAASGTYRVRGLVRRLPRTRPGDPAIDWQIGDLRDPSVRVRALSGARHVIHCASRVHLGHDPSGQSRAINVDATRGLLDEARAAGVERFIYTSTLQTLASGTEEKPATEDDPWNLVPVRSPYTETKREAEALVLAANSGRMQTLALCPGMTIGPRDPGPTSTEVLLTMSKTRIALLPAGGIPVIEVETLATAHVRALDRGEPGRRYAVIGPYLSFRQQAEMVASIAGRPRRILDLPDWSSPLLTSIAGGLDRLATGRWLSVSRAVVAGGYLRFHVDGARANHVFDLHHGPTKAAIRRSLVDSRDQGMAPWLRDVDLNGDDSPDCGATSP
ncbi:NAD-dependent epimerase/dehydratase family protein [Isosphaeraceae bacterium EP7]